MLSDHDYSGWEKIVFLTTMDRHRNKKEISDLFNVSVSGGPLYRESTNKGLEKMVHEGFLEKRGSTYKADLNSEAFKDELVDSFEDKGENNLELVAEDIEGFIDFLQSEAVKKHVLRATNVKEYYGEDKNAQITHMKEIPIQDFFSALISSMVNLWINEALEDHNLVNSDQMLGGMIKGMMSGLIESVQQDSKFNVHYILESIDKAYEKDPEAFEYIMDIYSSILTEQVQGFNP
jgi:hypothetical protein